MKGAARSSGGPSRLLQPELGGIDLAAATLPPLAMVALFEFHFDLPKTVAASVALGVLWDPSWRVQL